MELVIPIMKFSLIPKKQGITIVNLDHMLTDMDRKRFVNRMKGFGNHE
jgi:hypothetical protein